MKIKRVMAGIFAAVICSSMTLIPQTVEAFDVTLKNHSIDYICGSVNVPNGATVEARYTTDEMTHSNGELSLIVTVPDTVSEACFGVIKASNESSFTTQQSDCEITFSSIGSEGLKVLNYLSSDTNVILQHKFSICYDDWDVGDSLYLGDSCYKVDYADDGNLEIRVEPTHGETSFGNVLWNETQTLPELPQTEPVAVTEEVLPNPTAPWSVTEPATETAAQKDAASAFETTTTTEAVFATEPVSVTEAIETLPTPTMPLEAYYEVPETVSETTTADPLLYFNRDWMVYINLETLSSSRKDYCWDLDSRAVLGDADCDGSVTLVDAVVLARFLTENGQMPVGGIMNTDFNESGAPDLKDAVNLMRYACGDMTKQELMETSPFARHLPC